MQLLCLICNSINLQGISMINRAFFVFLHHALQVIRSTFELIKLIHFLDWELQNVNSFLKGKLISPNHFAMFWILLCCIIFAPIVKLITQKEVQPMIKTGDLWLVRTVFAGNFTSFEVILFFPLCVLAGWIADSDAKR